MGVLIQNIIYQALPCTRVAICCVLVTVDFTHSLRGYFTGIAEVLRFTQGQWCNIDECRQVCLVHPGVRDKRRVSEIDLSQPRHETGFWWRHNGPVTSQLTDRIKWPNYPLEQIGICVHINTHSKESLTQRCRRSTNVHLWLIFFFISIWLSLNGLQITVTPSP